MNDNRKFWVRTVITLGVFGATLYGFFNGQVKAAFFQGMLAGGIFQWYFNKDG